MRQVEIGKSIAEAVRPLRQLGSRLPGLELVGGTHWTCAGWSPAPGVIADAKDIDVAVFTGASGHGRPYAEWPRASVDGTDVSGRTQPPSRTRTEYW